LTPKKNEFEHDVKREVEAGVRQGVKAVLEEVLEEELADHLDAGYRELTPTRRGERNDHYQRNGHYQRILLTPAARSSAWRCRATARASSSRRSEGALQADDRGR
jgi:transposase-like protein